MAQKTDKEIAAEKKAAELKKATEKRQLEIKSAEDAYEAFEVKGPDDLVKKLELQKAVFEAKGADLEKNYEEKMQVLTETMEEAKAATDENYAEIKSAHDSLVKGFDALQIRIKNDNRTQMTEVKSESFVDMLKEGIQEVKGQFSEFANKKISSVSFQMKAVADMTFPVNFSTARTSVAYVRPGIIELPKRKVHVRELLQVGGMGNNATFNFVKEVTGDYLGAPSGSGPAPVAEATLKPQFDLKLVEAAVSAQWIAGWVRISRNMLDDVEGMTTFLQSRLPELLLRAEDTQILSGTGVSPQLSGITTAGNFTAPTAPFTATIDVEQLVQAISQLESYDREANGILLNPFDWYNIWLNKSTGSVAGLYNLPQELVARVNGQMYIAGVPVYRSTAIAVDKFIVGDWSMGANLILREAPRVEFFREDGINVRENMITVRVEERVALPIYGDNYFIYGDFGNAS
jgi:HK97 family phage major capsid protein